MLKIIPPWVFSMGGFRPTISLRRGSVCRRRCRQLSLVQKREHERRIPGRNQVNKLTGAERTEWMGMGEWVNGGMGWLFMVIMDHSVIPYQAPVSKCGGMKVAAGSFRKPNSLRTRRWMNMDRNEPFTDDLPSKTVVMFHSFVKLLHGNSNDWWQWWWSQDGRIRWN